MMIPGLMNIGRCVLNIDGYGNASLDIGTIFGNLNITRNRGKRLKGRCIIELSIVLLLLYLVMILRFKLLTTKLEYGF